MGRGNNQKYSRRELEQIIKDLGFRPDSNNGKVMGKGDHNVWVHEIYQDLKLVIPMAHRELCENEMSDICANIIIAMKVLGMDISKFTHKEGIEGKLMKTAKNAEKNICILFSPISKRSLGLNDEKDILNYIEETKKKIQKKINAFKK